jgi:hypothetical protein
MSMNKPNKVRQIYAELQSVYGGEIPARELLECASLIAEATEDSILETQVSLHVGRTPFAELPVDEVMTNWSWRVVNQEYEGGDDFMPQITQEMLLEHVLAIAA